jgi:hypothetical protein
LNFAPSWRAKTSQYPGRLPRPSKHHSAQFRGSDHGTV